MQANLVPTYGTNASLWSLAYEATFYLVLPLALFTVFARSTWAKLLSLALLVAVCAVGGLDVLMYLPVWLMGAAVAWNKDRVAGWLRGMNRRRLAIARALAVIALVLVMCLTAIRYSNLNVGLLALTTTILVALLVVDVSWTGAPATALGGLSRYADSSYSLYAVHLPIVALAAAILVPDAARRWEPTPAHWAAAFGIVAVMLVIGWLVATATELRTDRVRRSIEARLPVGRESRNGFPASRLDLEPPGAVGVGDVRLDRARMASAQDEPDLAAVLGQAQDDQEHEGGERDHDADPEQPPGGVLDGHCLAAQPEGHGARQRRLALRVTRTPAGRPTPRG